MAQEEMIALREKIAKGLSLSFERLVLQIKKEDGQLILGKNGQIIRINARDLK